MTTELENDAQLEIGHVLFMDIVGFSKLLLDEQGEASRRLNQIAAHHQPHARVLNSFETRRSLSRG